MLSFMCIGAQKAGTTWLHQMLSQHPEIWFESHRKEFHYWDRFEKGNVSEGTNDYLARFAGVDVVSGDMTPSYATLQTPTIAAIAERLEKLRIIFILRDPVMRAWSAARMFMQNAWIGQHDVSIQWINELCRCPSFTSRGHYSETLTRWSACFPAESFLILDYSDITNQPQQLLTRVVNHIGLKADPNWLEHCLNSRVVFGGPKWPLPAESSKSLGAYYARMNSELPSALDKIGQRGAVDLSGWTH